MIFGEWAQTLKVELILEFSCFLLGFRFVLRLILLIGFDINIKNLQFLSN
jgi:hypothetical protein